MQETRKGSKQREDFAAGDCWGRWAATGPRGVNDRLLMLKSVDQELEPQFAPQVTVMVQFEAYIREREAVQSKRRAEP